MPVMVTTTVLLWPLAGVTASSLPVSPRYSQPSTTRNGDPEVAVSSTSPEAGWQR